MTKNSVASSEFRSGIMGMSTVVAVLYAVNVAMVGFPMKSKPAAMQENIRHSLKSTGYSHI